MSVLVGMQPVLTQVPPKRLRSIMATVMPALVIRPASDGPAWPAPLLSRRTAADVLYTVARRVGEASLEVLDGGEGEPRLGHRRSIPKRRFSTCPSGENCARSHAHSLGRPRLRMSNHAQLPLSDLSQRGLAKTFVWEIGAVRSSRMIVFSTRS